MPSTDSNEQYNSIATFYKDSKVLPFRKYIEEYTLFSLLGDVTGKSILDLACGEGIYTRKLKQKGAKLVVGVDLSSEMIALALTEEANNPLGNIQYLVGDCTKLDKLDEFDIVVGSYLLNYARSSSELTAFGESIKRNLKVGGKFVGINDNPANSPKYFNNYIKYGFTKSTQNYIDGTQQEGSAIKYTLHNLDGTSFSFNNYYLSPSTCTKVFDNVGFSNFQWHNPLLSEVGVEEMGKVYWEEFLTHPPIVGVSALRS